MKKEKKENMHMPSDVWVKTQMCRGRDELKQIKQLESVKEEKEVRAPSPVKEEKEVRAPSPVQAVFL